MRTEIKQILSQAAAEIRQLRRNNEILSARVETMFLMADMVSARLPERQGIAMGEDIAWSIDRLLSEKDNAN